jgi:hypothetical protein
VDARELRMRLKRLRLTITEAAPLVGLTYDGLHRQLHGGRKVSRQTEIILGYLERDRGVSGAKTQTTRAGNPEPDRLTVSQRRIRDGLHTKSG